MSKIDFVLTDYLYGGGFGGQDKGNEFYFSASTNGMPLKIIQTNYLGEEV